MKGLLLLAMSGALLAAGAPQAEDAASLFKSKCQMCHGADGKGDSPAAKKMGVRSFRSPEVMKLSDAVLIDCTTKGRNKMPAYGQKLTDDQIKQLVKYIRTLK